MFRSLGLVLLLALAVPSLSGAAPFVPTDDAQVLERLPNKPGDPAARGLRDLRRRLAADPNNPAVATDLAERYFRLAVREGDPRFVGYAQAALTPWWKDRDPPVDVLVLRAGLTQYLHDFEAAIADLSLALAREPDNLTAWSYRSVIYIVQARYDEARSDCRELVRRARTSLVANACEPTVDALTGHAESAYAALQQALSAYPRAPANERLWVLTRLGEIAHRLGRSAEAEAHFRTALGLGIHDAYLLATYAEFLLDAKRPQELVDLLKDHTRNDVLLLRLALAEKALDLPAAKQRQAVVQARIDAARQRQDKLHLSDEALFELACLHHPRAAAQLARENWDLGQREPSDARILLEAALAARDPTIGRPAVEWLEGNRHEDRKLLHLAQQLKAIEP